MGKNKKNKQNINPLTTGTRRETMNRYEIQKLDSATNFDGSPVVESVQYLSDDLIFLCQHGLKNNMFLDGRTRVWDSVSGHSITKETAVHIAEDSVSIDDLVQMGYMDKAMVAEKDGDTSERENEPEIPSNTNSFCP